ncbi:MAG TPA: mannose-1-phosphate guanylyltransferase/mannose-6-phosphate isomerase [Burkholderiales bacterium]|nr:mannose-1-phosphate guanylyltransferase/mannose-6-phosphate isomerase [Burkholderiales bacterium]
MRTQPVILCGGAGTRLWPLSREQYPKQLLALNGNGNETLFQATARRLIPSGDAGNVVEEPILVCNEEHRFMIAEQLRAVGGQPKALILEPDARGTAPALTLAALHALEDDDPVLVVMPADHAIRDAAAFRAAALRGAQLAEEGDVVTFGIPPSYPETGYGYIRFGTAIGKADDAIAAHRVVSFVEKPDQETAAAYVASGEYLWNSGIFAVRASIWLNLIRHFRPEVIEACERARSDRSWDGDFLRLNRDAFATCPNDSIDYAVMEKLPAGANGAELAQAVVVDLDAGWSDVGAWNSLWDIGERDENGNLLRGDVCAVDTTNTLVVAQHRLVACVGLDDAVVVETADAVMVASKDQAQNVKQIVAKLKADGRQECFAHRKVYRPWGSYDGVDCGERFQVKRIVVNPGASLSLQMHHHRAEHWIVVRGTARVVTGDDEFLLTENQSTYVPVGVKHRLTNPGKVPLEIIEVQSGTYLGEDDIVRFEDSYGRG